jgi:hypothetical protein
VYHSAHPRIFPSDACPLCGAANANEFHILCECPAISSVRRVLAKKAVLSLSRARKRVAEHLEALSSRPGAPPLTQPPLGPPVTLDLLRSWYLPARRENFLWGWTPVAAQEWARSARLHHSQGRALPSLLSSVSTKMYRNIFEAFETEVSQRGGLLEQRCLSVYGSSRVPARDPVLDALHDLIPSPSECSPVLAHFRSLSPVALATLSSSLTFDLSNLLPALRAALSPLPPSLLSMSRCSCCRRLADGASLIICASPACSVGIHPLCRLPSARAGLWFCDGCAALPPFPLAPAPSLAPKRKRKVQAVLPRKRQESDSSLILSPISTAEALVACQICKSTDDGGEADDFLLCESSLVRSGRCPPHGAHARCLNLRRVPHTIWTCRPCGIALSKRPAPLPPRSPLGVLS